MIWIQKELSLVEKEIAPNIKSTSKNLSSSEQAKENVAAWHTAFPDLQRIIEEQMAKGVAVVTRFTLRGTSRKP